MAKHHPDLVFCRKQPGIALGRLCEKCDGVFIHLFNTYKFCAKHFLYKYYRKMCDLRFLRPPARSCKSLWRMQLWFIWGIYCFYFLFKARCLCVSVNTIRVAVSYVEHQAYQMHIIAASVPCRRKTWVVIHETNEFW